MMIRHFFVLCVALVWANAGCTTTGQKPIPPDDALNLQVKVLSAHPSANADDKVKPVLRIWMRPVPGGIGGNPTGRAIVDLKVHGVGRVTVSLRDIESGLAAAAKVPRGQGDIGTFDPINTRVARLGTFSMNLSAPVRNYFTGLRDPESRHGLLLVYVDRPCTIHGQHGDLVLTRAGLNWIEHLDPPSADPEAPQHYKVREDTREVVYYLLEEGTL